MRYIIETTEDGVKETLEYMGNTLVRNHVETENGSKCTDPKFTETLSTLNGYSDHMLNDMTDMIENETTTLPHHILEFVQAWGE